MTEFMHPLSQMAVEEVEGIAALGIDPLAILLQSGTFLILFFIIKKYALEKIVAALEDRRRTIDESLTSAEQIEKRLALTTEETKQLLSQARNDADTVIAKAHEEAGIMIKTAEDTASSKAEQIITDAHARIDSDIAKSKKELERDMRVLVAEAVEVIIDEKLDDKKDAALIKKALVKSGVQS